MVFGAVAGLTVAGAVVGGAGAGGTIRIAGAVLGVTGASTRALVAAGRVDGAVSFIPAETASRILLATFTSSVSAWQVRL